MRVATTGELPESPCTVNVPEMVPAAVGFTPTVIEAVCPTGNAIGVVNPVTLNCGLETEACVMFRAVLPVFETDTVCVVVFPTVTFPKLMLPGNNWKIAWTACLLPLTTPAHPFSSKSEGMDRARSRKQHIRSNRFCSFFLFCPVAWLGPVMDGFSALFSKCESKIAICQRKLARGPEEGQ